jgi:uncharacterized protein YutE (UPF0331/DUF86 family)
MQNQNARDHGMPTPADEQIVEFNAQLDALAREWRTALDAPPVSSVTGKTGMERALEIIASAPALIQKKLATIEQKTALERYAAALEKQKALQASAPDYAELQRRADGLRNEIVAATNKISQDIYRSQSEAQRARQALTAMRVPAAWIDAITLRAAE